MVAHQSISVPGLCTFVCTSVCTITQCWYLAVGDGVEHGRDLCWSRHVDDDGVRSDQGIIHHDGKHVTDDHDVSLWSTDTFQVTRGLQYKLLCITLIDFIPTMPQSFSASSTPTYSKKLANPSFSHRSSHQSMVTMLPNHCRKTTRRNTRNINENTMLKTAASVVTLNYFNYCTA